MIEKTKAKIAREVERAKRMARLERKSKWAGIKIPTPPRGRDDEKGASK